MSGSAVRLLDSPQLSMITIVIGRDLQVANPNNVRY